MTDDDLVELLPEDGSPLPYETLIAKAQLDRVDLAHALKRLYIRGLIYHEHNRGWRRKIT